MALTINSNLQIEDDEYTVSAIRAQGAGGQNVNKVASAIQLRFSINESSLSDAVKQRLLKLSDSRVTKDGVFVVKSQEFRTQEKNLKAAQERLIQFILKGTLVRKKRIATKPSLAAKKKRLDDKGKQAKKKTYRQKPSDF